MILTHRPVPHALSQGFGSNATAGVVPNQYGTAAQRLVYLFGNYQPVGHLACDFACPSGTPVGAAAPGTAMYAGLSQHMPRDIAAKYGYIFGSPDSGNIVVVDHGDNTATAYSHMSAVHVSAGQRVGGGQTLGLSGATGRVDGAHLHFEYMTLPINYNSLYYSRLDPMAQYGGASILPVGAIIEEEEIVPNQSDRVFDAINGDKVSLNELLNQLDRQTKEGRDLARAALQAVGGILATRIPDPTDRSKSYTIADYIVWGATNSKTAAGAAGQTVQNTSPEALAKALQDGAAGVTAQAVADQLQVNITTKEK